MKSFDNAISLSLDINHYYKTLQNMYKDKLQYIEKLKEKRTNLQSDLDATQKQLDEFQNLLNNYHFSDINSLKNFLDKNLSE